MPHDAPARTQHATLSIYFRTRVDLEAFVAGLGPVGGWRHSESRDRSLHGLHFSSLEYLDETHGLEAHLDALRIALEGVGAAILRDAARVDDVILWVYADLAGQANAGITVPSRTTAWLGGIGAAVCLDIWPGSDPPDADRAGVPSTATMDDAGEVPAAGGTPGM